MILTNIIQMQIYFPLLYISLIKIFFLVKSSPIEIPKNTSKHGSVLHKNMQVIKVRFPIKLIELLVIWTLYRKNPPVW